MKRLTTEEFIEKARAVHGDRYDYSQVVYVNSRTKVKVVCRDHGPFAQLANSHIVQKSGCPDCGGNKPLTTKSFIDNAIAVHGDRYDYSQVEYLNGETKVTIICPDHGPFEQTPIHHYHSKSGCPDCAGLKKLTTDTFIEKARAIHGDHYDYSQVRYVNSRSGITIICPDHGPFEQKPAHHLTKIGCPDCGGRKQLTTETFIEKAKVVHGDRYDYSQVEYVNTMTPVTVICADHGPFLQAPNNHLSQASGCPDCGGHKPLTTETFIEKAKVVHGDRYDYSQAEYLNAGTNVTIICRDHGPFPQGPGVHFAGSGCPDCAETGFNPSERGLLYYLAISTDDGDTRYKIGITNFTVEERFAGADLARIRIVETWQYAIGRVAADREAEILRLYAGDRYFGPDILLSGGNTELFTHDILGLDKRDEEDG